MVKVILQKVGLHSCAGFSAFSCQGFKIDRCIIPCMNKKETKKSMEKGDG